MTTRQRLAALAAREPLAALDRALASVTLRPGGPGAEAMIEQAVRQALPGLPPTAMVDIQLGIDPVDGPIVYLDTDDPELERLLEQYAAGPEPLARRYPNDVGRLLYGYLPGRRQRGR